MSTPDQTHPQRTDGLAYPLDREDARVQAARQAEQRAYEHYGFEISDHFVDVPSLATRIRVVEVGAGPPVVLIPGSFGHGVVWTPLLPELDGYTLYVMDRPGGGLSDGIDYREHPLRTIAARSTAALFDRFELDTAPLVGHSMGGLYSLRFALEHPERASGVALLGCPMLYPGTSPPVPIRLMSLRVVGKLLISRIQSDDVGELSEMLVDIAGHPEETVEAVPVALLEAIHCMENVPHVPQSMVSMLQRMFRLRGTDPEAALPPDDLNNVNSPVSLIWGSEDPFGSVEQGRAGAEHFPDVEFHDVGVGTFPWFDAPDTCGELMRDFLDSRM